MLWQSLEGFDAQAIIDSLPFYVLVIDEDHYIWMANQAVRRGLGVNPEDVIGRHCPTVIHNMSAYPGCPLEEAVSSGRDIERELVDDNRRYLSCVYDTGFTTPDGKKLFLHTTRPLPDFVPDE